MNTSHATLAVAPSPAHAAAPEQSRFKGRIFLTRAAAVPFFLLLLVAEDRWDDKSRWHVDDLFIAAGLLAVTVAILGRLWCTLYIGGRKTSSLITQGPYSLCRNPLYFFSAIGVLGLAATTSMITLVALVGAAFTLYYPAVIAGEEKRLAAGHGAAFEAYRASTPRFLPSFKNFHDTASVEFRPEFLYRALKDAAGFAAVWVAMFVINAAHDHGYLPIWIHLY